MAKITGPESTLSGTGFDLDELLAEGAVAMFQNQRFDRALEYVLAALRIRFPVSRLMCFLSNSQDNTIVPVGGYSLYQNRVVAAFPFDKVVPPDLYARFQRAVDNEPFALEPIALGWQVNPIWEGYETHKAYLRLPISTGKAVSMHLALWADELGVFSQENIPYFKKITQPFSRAVRESFFDQPPDFLVSSSSEQSTTRMHVPLLRMCKGLKDVVQEIEHIAPSPVGVLITGETGVGKELVAESLYELSPLRGKPFVKVNCAAIPESLIDSAFFGHEKGAFTGAISASPGYFEQAHGGILFLDEVGELSLNAQSRLLRALDRHEIQRVGASQTICVNTRVIAATNKPLEEMVEEGTFRRDLFYRLHISTIHIPPLRSRPIDIMALADFLIASKATELGMESHPLSSKELSVLCAYPWPGNVRELEHCLTRALLRAKHGSTYGPLEFDLPRPKPAKQMPPAPVAEQPHSPAPYAPAPKPVQKVDPSLLYTAQQDTWPSLDAIIEAHIHATLQKTRGKVYGENGAANLLGIHPNTLNARVRNSGKGKKQENPEKTSARTKRTA